MQVSSEFGQSAEDQQSIVDKENTGGNYSSVSTRNHQQKWEPDTQVEKN